MAHGCNVVRSSREAEVLGAMSIDIEKDDTFDWLIPLAVYRHTNPQARLSCSLVA
jgi:hypothetical protein